MTLSSLAPPPVLSRNITHSLTPGQPLYEPRVGTKTDGGLRLTKTRDGLVVFYLYYGHILDH